MDTAEDKENDCGDGDESDDAKMELRKPSGGCMTDRIMSTHRCCVSSVVRKIYNIYKGNLHS